MLIEHPAQVSSLARRVRPWSKGFAGTVALALPSLSARENLAFQSRLNILLDACGCGTGGVFSVAAIILVLLAALSGATWLADLGPLGTTGVALTAFVMGGALGKALGLVHAHVRLRRTLEELYERVAVEESTPGPSEVRSAAR